MINTETIHRVYRFLSLLFIICIIISLTVTQDANASASIRYVVPEGKTTGSCESWENACDLQYALSLALTADELWVKEGTYKPTISDNRNTAFHLKSGVGIYGGFTGNETNRDQREWVNNVTVLSGNIGDPASNIDNSYHVVIGSGTDLSAVLDGFTITGGNADGIPPNSDGGGIYNLSGSPSLINLTITNNAANFRGGGIYNSEGNPQIFNVTLIHNMSFYNGGGILNNNSNPTMTNVNITENTALVGGGFYNVKSNPLLSNVSITGNSANSFGGGMYNYMSSPFLVDVYFESNFAVFSGGGLYNLISNPNLANVTFNGNSAGSYGGGLYNNNSAPQLTNITISNNNTDLYGGGLYNSNNSSLLLSNVDILNNTASFNGGGIYEDANSHSSLVDVRIIGNTAQFLGGGMYTAESSPNMTEVTFEGNSAEDGGGMYNLNSAPNLTLVTFSNNSATNNGAGVFNFSSNTNFDNVTFNSNISQNNGGGIYNSDGLPNFSQVIFNGNSSANFGGAVYNYNSNFNMMKAVFENNSAGNHGGGIFNHYFASPTLTYITFKGNSAGSKGGGLYNSSDSNPLVLNVTFKSNTAEYFGGGLYNNYSNPSLVNVIFFENISAFQGGAIYNYHSVPVLTNVTANSNIASEQAGGIYNEWSNPSIHNSILWDNNPNEVYDDSNSTSYITFSDLRGGCPEGSTCENVVDEDPLFSDSTNGNFHLGLTSPAVDTADSTRVPPDTLDLDNDGDTLEPLPFDLDGNPRIVNDIVDMGVYERFLNYAPIAGNDNYLTYINIPLIIPAPGVLQNDSDQNGDELVARIDTYPAYGDIDFNLDGSFIYNPDLNYDGWDSFTYHATDGVLDSNTATVSIRVMLENYPPEAMDDSYELDEDSPLSVAAPGVLGNDSDPDGDILIALLESEPMSGTLSFNSNGSFIYEPFDNYYGMDSFTYVASDSLLNSQVATVYLTVNPINDPPEAKDDAYSTIENSSLIIPSPGVLINDTDIEGDTLYAYLVSEPISGTIDLQPDGSFVYTPFADQSGEDSFTYKANDGELDSNITTVSITIIPINHPPIASDDSFVTDKNTPLDVSAPGVLINDLDIEGDQLFAFLAQEPIHGTLQLEMDGSFTYIPDHNYIGKDTFVYFANDGESDSNYATVTITVSQVWYRIYLPLISR